MPEETPHEPYVFLEAPVAKPQRRLPDGRRPSILLLDGNGFMDREFAPRLEAEGFEVFGAHRCETALGQLEESSCIVMALVQLGLPHLPVSKTIRALAEARPGLWIGMVGDPADRASIENGYRAGAADLIAGAVPPDVSVERIARSLPRAIERRRAAEKQIPKKVQQWAPARTMAGLLLIAAVLGVLLAALTQSWQQSTDRWTAQLDRIAAALEFQVPVRNSLEAQYERMLRSEELQLRRQGQRETLLQQREQLEETRIDHVLRSQRPTYPLP